MGCISSKPAAETEPVPIAQSDEQPKVHDAKPTEQAGVEVPPLVEAIIDKVKVHIGPLEFSSDGVVLKPKFNVGIQVGEHPYA
jgi:hypothetical protein